MLDKLKKTSDSYELELYTSLPKKLVEIFIVDVAEYKGLRSEPQSDKLKEIEKQIQMFSLSDDTMGWLTWRNTHKIFMKSVNFNNKTTETKVIQWLKDNKDVDTHI
jgi:hypothetical protein